MIAFLREAGLDAEAMADGSLVISGRLTHPLGHLPPPQTLEWKGIADSLSLEYAASTFIQSLADNSCFDDGLRGLLRSREKGFAVMRGDVRLALIQATQAQLRGGAIVFANFLTPGSHWQEVADLVRAIETDLAVAGEHVAEPWDTDGGPKSTVAPVGTRLLDRFPDAAALDLIDACLVASRRIRQERQVAYGRAVALESDIGELVLFPVARAGTRLCVPFRLSNGAKVLAGQLVLEDRDPLPLLIGRDVNDKDAITAWACALLGFADATCTEFDPASQRERRSNPARQPSPGSPPVVASAARTLPNRWTWSERLTVLGPWARYRGALVAGHRRHLDDGRTPSSEARKRASDVGIDLAPDETWVRPYARGIPKDLDIRFRWLVPPVLRR